MALRQILLLLLPKQAQTLLQVEPQKIASLQTRTRELKVRHYFRKRSISCSWIWHKQLLLDHASTHVPHAYHIVPGHPYDVLLLAF